VTPLDGAIAEGGENVGPVDGAANDDAEASASADAGGACIAPGQLLCESGSTRTTLRASFTQDSVGGTELGNGLQFAQATIDRTPLIGACEPGALHAVSAVNAINSFAYINKTISGNIADARIHFAVRSDVLSSTVTAGCTLEIISSTTGAERALRMDFTGETITMGGRSTPNSGGVLVEHSAVTLTSTRGDSNRWHTVQLNLSRTAAGLVSARGQLNNDASKSGPAFTMMQDTPTALTIRCGLVRAAPLAASAAAVVDLDDVTLEACVRP